MAPGILITLEGGEGAGKSTQTRMLARRLGGLGRAVETTREPGGTAIGGRIRELVQGWGGDGLTPLAELLLYLADRAQHVEKVIAPALAGGAVVLSDRFADSSEVYQGRARGLGWELVRLLNQQVCGPIWPALTLVLDVDPSQGLARVAQRTLNGLDRLEAESMGFHHKVRQGFLDQALAEPQRIKVVDASLSQDQVANAIWEIVQPVVNSSRQTNKSKEKSK